MKISNNFKKLFTTILAITVLAVSCNEDFLNVEPTGSLSNSTLANKAGVEGLLIGAYAALNGVFGNRFEAPNHWATGSILGGDANKGTDPGDYSTLNPIQR